MGFLISLLAGLVFGMGLVLSGMSNPSKVLNFLDLFGNFDPSLIFVMAGAIGVTYFGYRWIWRRERPLHAASFEIPTAEGIDGRLISGALFFGVGWGLVGFCPGPALTSLTFGGLGVILFVVAMLIGMIAARLVKLFL